ncbi:TIGR03016 family PEP-CTERM system-associated outer membrane protein [Desulfovibrio mangrovi]|uniref:TIGR03016 family PEP-CTERM system-associated outer membrane protein n=1 Tax=Desulfovibrio mangrovi TaxID=2976983 RepID=UPI002247ED59|nr:TIGR03016 family PEP-CTERM system-associated outer membrane protein [Desulfovibrio mangrovi]UZP67546.1 TIGR03016 family PEP-CTERM system-associated outer membrane protein [Desulfovibrio mangrovi]
MLLSRSFMLFCTLLLLTSQAFAGDLSFKPGIGVSEEYTDNVDETPEGKTDYISHIKPLMELEYDGPRLQTSLSYAGDYQMYASGKNTDLIHDLSMESLVTLMQDRLFLEVTEDYESVYLDSTRGEVADDETGNYRVDRNTFGISPYAMFDVSDQGILTAGYKFLDVRYTSGDEGSDKQEHKGYTSLDYSLTDRLGLLTGYSLTAQDQENKTGLKRHNAYGGARYAFSETFDVTARLGADYTVFNSGGDAVDPFWEIEATKRISRLTLTLASATAFTSDPDTEGDLRTTSYSLKADWDLDRTKLRGGLRYSDSDQGGGARSEELRDSSGYDAQTFTPSVGVTHELTDRLSLDADLRMDFQDKSGDYVQRFFASTGLSYLFTEEVSSYLRYKFKDSYSGTDEDSNYSVNRVELGVEVKF